MPTLQRFPDCRVLLYFDDHPPPHVHIVKNDDRECVVDIETGVLHGKLAAREIREALRWIESERSFLMREWLRCNT
jgi:hypothetical protein